ncbi:MAG TPA: hypothetical protein ENL00_04780 [Nitratifractor sp.]|nr:hypothetical protein [Nitratifractor sp.]
MHGCRSMESILSKEQNSLFEKIRINFLFNHPFLSVLALSIPTTFGQHGRSAFETNGYTIRVDYQKLEHYTPKEITYLYAHTLLHIVLKHPLRRQGRKIDIWNQSCDIVINLILEDFNNIGLRPEDEFVDSDLKDKCVEEVYEILQAEESESKDDGSEEESKESKAKAEENPKGKEKVYRYNPQKRDIDEVENINSDKGEREKLDGVIIQALTIAKRSTNQYSRMQIEIDELIKPEISLEDTLKEYLISSLFEKESSYTRPNRRFVYQGIYMPGYKKRDEMLEIYIALDSSSSVTLDEYRRFLGVIQDVCEGFYEYKITVLPFDLEVKKSHIVEFDSFNAWSSKDMLIPKSDGGTNFNAVLQYLKATTITANSLLMVLSDGEFEVNESLVSQTLFVLSDNKNSQKFNHLGRTILF